MRIAPAPKTTDRSEWLAYLAKFTAHADAPYNLPSPCWVWTRGKCSGYGVLGWQGRVHRLHRLVYFILREDPGEFQVCHRCDNPSCCNPDHLFLGTAADNNRDRESKGRTIRGRNQPHGSQQPNAKLSESDIATIRDLAEYRSFRSIARDYGVHHTTIMDIVRGNTWRRVS